MTARKRFLRWIHLLFLLFLLIQLLPDQVANETYAAYAIWFGVGVEVLVLFVSALVKKQEGLNLFLDIVGFLYGLLILWILATAKFNLLSEVLFPPPGRVFEQFVRDFHKIVVNIKSSVGIILQGYVLATIIAIPLWTISRVEREARQCGHLYIEVSRINTADCVHPLRNRLAAHLSFRLGLRHLSSCLLAHSSQHHERCIECGTEDNRFRESAECQEVYHVIFCDPPGRYPANFYRL